MNFQIEWHYKSSKHKQLIFTSDFTDANEALMIVGDLEKQVERRKFFYLMSSSKMDCKRSEKALTGSTDRASRYCGIF